MKSTFFRDLDQTEGCLGSQGMMEKECETVTNPALGERLDEHVASSEVLPC